MRRVITGDGNSRSCKVCIIFESSRTTCYYLAVIVYVQWVQNFWMRYATLPLYYTRILPIAQCFYFFILILKSKRHHLVHMNPIISEPRWDITDLWNYSRMRLVGGYSGNLIKMLSSQGKSGSNPLRWKSEVSNDPSCHHLFVLDKQYKI